MDLITEISHEYFRKVLLFLISAQEHSQYSNIISVGISSILVIAPVILISSADALARCLFRPFQRVKSPRQKKIKSILNTDHVDEATMMITSLKSNISCLNDVNETTASELLETLSKLHETTADVTNLRETIASLETIQNDFERGTSLRSQQIQDLESQLFRLKEENSSLVSVTEDVKSFETECKYLKSQMELLQSAKIEMESKLLETQSLAAQSNETIFSLENKVTILNADFELKTSSYAHNISVLETELMQCKQEAMTNSMLADSASQQRIQELETDIASLSQSYQVTKDSYDSEIVQLKTALTSQSQVLSELTNAKEALENQIDSYKQEAYSSTNKVSVLKAELAKQVNVNKLTLKEQYEEINTTRFELENKKALVDDLLEVNTKAVCEIDELKYNFSVMNANMKDKLERVESELLASQQQVEGFRVHIGELHQALEAKEGERQSLMFQYHALEEVSAAAIQQSKAMEATQESLIHKLDDLNAAYQILEQEKATAVQDAQVQWELMMALEEAVEMKRVESETLASRIKEYQENISTLQQQLEEQQCSYAEVTTLKQQMEEELVSIRSEVIGSQERYNHLKAEMARQAVSSKLALKENQSKLLTLHDANDVRIADLNIEIEQLRLEVSSLQEDKESVVSSTESLKQEVSEKTSQLEKELEEHKKYLFEAQEAQSLAEDKAKALSYEVNSLRHELNSLQEQGGASSSSQEEYIASLKDQITSHVESIATLEETQVLMDQEILIARAEVSASNERCGLLKAELAKQSISNKLLMKEHQTQLEALHEARVEELTQELDAIRQKEEEHSVGFVVTQQRIFELETQVETQHALLDGAQAAQREVEARALQLESEIEVYRNRLVDISVHVTAMPDDSAAPDVTVESTRHTDTITQLEAVLETQRLSLVNLERSNSQLEEELSLIKSEMSAGNERFNLLKAEMAKLSVTHKLALKETQSKLTTSGSQAEAKIAALLVEIQSMREDVAALVQEKQSFVSLEEVSCQRVALLENQVEQQSDMLLQVKASKEQAEERAAVLELQLQELKVEMDQLQLIRESATVEDASTSDSVLDAQRSVIALHQELDEARTAMRELEHRKHELEQEVLMVRAEVMNGVEKYNLLKAELARQTVTHKLASKDNQSKISSLAESNSALEGKLREVTEEKNDVMISVTRLEADKSELIRAQLDAAAASQSEIHTLQGQLDQKTLNLGAVVAARVAAEERCVVLEKKVAAAQYDTEVIQEELSTLRSTYELRSLHDAAAYEALLKEKSNLEVQIRDCLLEKSEADQQVVKYRSELELLQGSNAELSQCKLLLESQVAVAEKEILTLREECSQQGTANKDAVIVLNNEIIDFRLSVAELESIRGDLEHRLVEVNESNQTETLALQELLIKSEARLVELNLSFEELTQLKLEQEKEYTQAVELWTEKEAQVKAVEEEMLKLNSKYESTTAEYISQLDILQMELIANRSTLNETIHMKDDLTLKLAEATTSLERASNSIVELESEIRAMSNKYHEDLKELTSKYEAEMLQHRLTSEALLELHASFEHLKEHRNSSSTLLHACLKELEASKWYVNTLQEEIKGLHDTKTTEAAHQHQRVEDLQASLATAELRLNEALVSQSTAEHNAELLDKELIELKTQLQVMSTAKETLMLATTLSATEYGTMLTTLQTEVAKHQALLEELQASKAAVEAESELLQVELVNVKGDNATLKSDLIDEANLYKTTLKEHHEALHKLQMVIQSQAESHNEVLQTLSRQSQEAVELKGKLQGVLTAQAMQVEKYESEIQALSTDFEKTDMNYVSELSRTRRELQESLDLIASLQAVIDEKSTSESATKNEFESLHAQISDLSSQVHRLESELKLAIEMGQHENLLLKDQLIASEHKITEYLRSVDALSAENNTLLRRVDSSGEQMSDAIEELKSAEVERLQQDKEMVRLRVLIAENESARNQLKDEANKMSDLLKNEHDKNTSLRIANEGLHSKLVALNENLELLQTQKQQLESELSQQELVHSSNIHALKAEIASSLNDISELKKVSNAMREKAGLSEVELDTLRQQLQAANTAKEQAEEGVETISRDASHLNAALVTLLDKYKLSVVDQLKDITLSELERKSLQSILDEVQRAADEGAAAIESMELLSAYIDVLTRELTSLKQQVKSVATEGEVNPPNDAELQELMASHDVTIVQLKDTLRQLESDLETSKSHESHLLLELQNISTQYQRSSNELSQVKDELAEVQSQYSRVLVELETSALLSTEPSIVSIKQFPTISDIVSKPETLVQNPPNIEYIDISKQGPALSPLSTTTALTRSPNKIARRLRAVEEREESEITMPFVNASIMDILPPAGSDSKSGDEGTVFSSLNPTITRTGIHPLNLLASIIKPKTKMLVLCDMSATMVTAGRLKAQRKCVYSIANASIENNSSLGLSYWNSKLHWVGGNEGDRFVGWRRGEEILTGFKALETVQPEGGHDMRNALETAIRVLPDATDIVVICHGITWPFEPLAVSASTHIVSNWMAFRRRSPGIKFHFIALGTSADKKALQRMAKDGDGCFVIISNNPR